jgi:hypothetical protein
MAKFIKIALWNADGLAQNRVEVTLLRDPTSRYPIIMHTSPITQTTPHMLVQEYSSKTVLVIMNFRNLENLPTSYNNQGKNENL